MVVFADENIEFEVERRDYKVSQIFIFLITCIHAQFSFD